MESRQRRSDDHPNDLSRRSFVAGGAAAATFTVVRAGLAQGTKANSRVKVGCVGVGGRGGRIARHLRGHDGYEVAAIADYFPKVAKGIGKELGVGEDRCFSGLDGYKGLVASDVDAVFLETPPYFFPAHAKAAVDAGKHVYVAKPIAVDVPGCLQILESGRKATRTGKVFLVDFQTRTDPFHIEAIKRVHEGALGKIGSIHSYYYDECFRDPPMKKTIEERLRGLIWVNDTALGGAYIANCDIHAIDVALWIAGGPPERAVGYSCRNRKNPNGDSDDNYAVTYRFADGAVMTNRSEHVRNNHSFSSGCNAYGEEAYIETCYNGKTWLHGIRNAYKGGECEDLYRRGIEANVNTFHASVINGVHDNPTVEPSVNSTLASILGREAARARREITWAELLKDKTRLEVDLTGLAV